MSQRPPIDGGRSASGREQADEKIERLLDDAVRGLPLRRAPAALQAAVLDELQRRAALPWWRCSFAYWPAPARSAFVVFCAALIGMTFLGGAWAIASLRAMTDSVAAALAWTKPVLALTASAGGVMSLLAHSIPPLWMYGIFGMGVVLYLLLFGLGAAAYRTLYLAR
jgi:hypothetical protein